MTDLKELLELRRRSWLLYKAMECVPLDRALELARTADQFVSGVPSEEEVQSGQRSTIPALQPRGDEPKGGPEAETPPANGASVSPGRSNLPLSPEQRERLVHRPAMGARNAELAAEFGLAPRQVQGIRISQARIAKLNRSEAKEDPPLVDEVVRFLRQQDDVVVRQGDGRFLVNGRFHFGVAQLVERANRMRVRQGKPTFGASTISPQSKNLPPDTRQPSQDLETLHRG